MHVAFGRVRRRIARLRPSFVNKKRLFRNGISSASAFARHIFTTIGIKIHLIMKYKEKDTDVRETQRNN